MQNIEVLIIGAGAAGLMCAIEAGKRRRKVLVLDHSNKVGKKILMSGGGRCNFTNYNVKPECYISNNPHFCKSALSRYTQWDFIELVKKHKIPFHEKTLGQLFCDNKASDIVQMLLKECEQAKVNIILQNKIEKIEKMSNNKFKISTSSGIYIAQSLVIATGGLSIPTMGATPFGYQIAEQFGIKVWPTRAGLVPLTLHKDDKEKFSSLSGISILSKVFNEKKYFLENILFTHRGISGPAILQISSYWQPGETIEIDLLPELSLIECFKNIKKKYPKKQLKTFLMEFYPKRLVEVFLEDSIALKILQNFTDKEFEKISLLFKKWHLKPNGTEGYRTAEVTLGGIDCNAISSKTMESNEHKGLYFIGEVLDVAGWLGGYNFQWAWASGWCAGHNA